MPTVAGFNLTPVKSTALQPPDHLDLGPAGAVGDRRFLFARETGERLSGISKASLMPIRSRWDRDGERLELSLDGMAVEDDAHSSGEQILVRLFDREIPTRRVGTTFDRFVHDVANDDTLSLLRVHEPEYAGGRHRVSLIARSSVDDLGRRGAGNGLDPRRVRMLIEIDGLDAYEEDSWEGRTIRIGEAVVRCGARMNRCVMTTLDPDTGAQNAPVLDTLASYRKVGAELLLGVSADVLQPGRIHVGDPIAILPD